LGLQIRPLFFLIWCINLGLAQIAVLDGHTTSGKFGYALTGEIDFNNDGFNDVVVGEPGWSKVYLYFGSSSFDTTPDLIFLGIPGTQFGNSLASLGDISGDGVDDLAIGAPRDNAGGTNAGRVYMHFGSVNPDTIPDLILTGQIRSGRFGTSISGGYDVNRDGGMDILVGAPGDCKAFLFLGGDSLDTIPDLTLHDGNGDYYGLAVALLGDVNGDTFGDILVGDYRHTGSILHGGGCFLYFGGNPPDPNVDITWEGDEQNRQLGISVAALGDLNGDGLNDIGLGASMTNKIHIHFGSQNIGQPPDIVLQGNDWFGCWIAGQCDINNDGYDDLMVGADGDNYGTPYGPGYAYLFLGGNPMNTVPDTILVGEAEGDMFGSCVSFCGDINGDQYREFCIGAPGHDSRGLNAGRVYIYNTLYTRIADSFVKTNQEPIFNIIPGTIVNARHQIAIDCLGLENSNGQLKIIDVMGRTVFSENIRHQPSVIFLPNLPAGVYSIILQNQSNNKKQNFILIR